MTDEIQVVYDDVQVAHFLGNFTETILNYEVGDRELILNTGEEVVYLLAYVVAVFNRVYDLQHTCNTRVAILLMTQCEFQLAINAHSLVE